MVEEEEVEVVGVPVEGVEDVVVVDVPVDGGEDVEELEAHMDVVENVEVVEVHMDVEVVEVQIEGVEDLEVVEVQMDEVRAELEFLDMLDEEVSKCVLLIKNRKKNHHCHLNCRSDHYPWVFQSINPE